MCFEHLIKWRLYGLVRQFISDVGIRREKIAMRVNNLSKIRLQDCAMLIIDMQNDFIADDAPIRCPGGGDIIPNIREIKHWAHTHNIPVFYTKEEHRWQKTDFGMETQREEPEHCLEGTLGVEIVSGLEPGQDDYIIIKRRYSGFYHSDLDVLLSGLGKNVLLVAGVATNVCVYATVLDAHQRDMRSVVLRDCVAGTSLELHEAFLKNIDYVLGDVITSNELMRHFDDGGITICKSTGREEGTYCRCV